MFGLALLPATAEAQLPEHGHMLVLHVEFENGEPVGFQRCVDIANNNVLPHHVHHETIHTGRAGEALIAAGHMVVPTSPVTPFANCAELEAAFGGG